MLGTLKSGSIRTFGQQRSVLIGKELEAKARIPGLLSVRNVYELGRVANWDDLELFVITLFSEGLKTDASTCPVCLQSPLLKVDHNFSDYSI